MALRIVEQVGASDVGRQRSATRTRSCVAPPLFAVADGMGGARAGEVASAHGGRGVRRRVGVGRAARRRSSREPAQEANRRIYDLAAADESPRGMGTTLTAAMVSGDEVSLGHVGDSRAYRLRDGELEQLTRDHSLVAELERTGQITPGGGRAPPAALDHHARARARARAWRSTPTRSRAAPATSTCSAPTA